VTLNHRLTCSPVYLDSFLLVTPNSSYPARIRVGNFSEAIGGMWSEYNLLFEYNEWA
jgi:hypothetical protein